jgi:hypothetical protein
VCFLVAVTSLVNNVVVYFLVADVPVVAVITPTDEKRFAPRILRCVATNKLLPLSWYFNRMFSE